MLRKRGISSLRPINNVMMIKFYVGTITNRFQIFFLQRNWSTNVCTPIVLSLREVIQNTDNVIFTMIWHHEVINFPTFKYHNLCCAQAYQQYVTLSSSLILKNMNNLIYFNHSKMYHFCRIKYIAINNITSKGAECLLVSFTFTITELLGLLLWNFNVSGS